MHRLTFLYITAVLLIGTMLVTGCKKDDDDGVAEEVEPINVNRQYVPIDWSSASLVSSDESSGAYSIRFADTVPFIMAGSIIAIDRDTVVYYRFVETATINGNTISITSSEATLADIFYNSGFTLSTAVVGKLKSSVIHPVAAYCTEDNGGYRELNLTPQSRVTRGLWRYENDNDSSVMYSDNGFTASLQKIDLNLNLDFEMYMNFGDKTRELHNNYIERYRSRAQKLKASFVGVSSIEQRVRCDVQGSCNYSHAGEVWRNDFLHPLSVRFVVKGVPIVVTLRADLCRQAEIMADGDIRAEIGFSDQVEGRLGLDWQQSGGITPVSSLGNTFRILQPTLSGKGDVQSKVGVFPRLRATMGGVTGVTIEMKPYITDTVQGGYLEQMLGQNTGLSAWTLGCRMQLNSTCGLNTRFISDETQNISKPEWTIFDSVAYHAPSRLEHLSGNPSRGQSSMIRFKVLDRNYLLDQEVLSSLSQYVEFQANGDISSDYGIASDGIVSVVWTPTANDVLYARIYDKNHVLLDCDTVWVSNTFGVQWVDLGLPSGLLWAPHNVGAISPEDYGDYFAWAETQPKMLCNWTTYTYCCYGVYDQLTKYCNNPGFGCDDYIDTLVRLQPGDDAATANWRGGARTPTKEEWDELLNNTTSQWTTENGVAGLRLTAPNGRSIFLPAAGYRTGTTLDDDGRHGMYWASSMLSVYPYNAWYMYFDSNYKRMHNDYRSNGHVVRPVRSTR